MFFSLWNVTNLILTNDFCFISNPGSSSSLFSGLPTSINDIKYSFGIGFGGREGISMGYHFRGDIYSKPNFILRLAKRFLNFKIAINQYWRTLFQIQNTKRIRLVGIY